jgi:hypothetical protein
MYLWTTKSLPSSSMFVGRKSTQPSAAPAKIRACISGTVTTWNSFGERGGPPSRHFLHPLMSSEISIKVSRVTSSLPVDTNFGNMGVGRQRVVRSTLDITICNLEVFHKSNQRSKSLFRLLFANLPIHRPRLKQVSAARLLQAFQDISIGPPGFCSLLSPTR